MRKALIFLLCAAELLLFGGRGGLRQNSREVEQLLVIQTMGLDTMRGGVTLSLAAAGEAERGVARMKAEGVSISAAMDRIRGYSYEEELFCPHIGQLLLGEKTAEQGIESTLAYICRSPDLRLDMPLFVVRGGTAEDALMNVGTGEKGISDVMQIVEQDVKRRGGSGLTTAAQILRDTARGGSALICALNPGPAAETLSGADEKADGDERSIAPLGYAILREGRLCRYLTEEQGIAVGFLKNRVVRSTVQLRDSHGSNAVLEINGGSSRIRPLWEGEVLRGLEVHADARASILERGAVRPAVPCERRGDRGLRRCAHRPACPALLRPGAHAPLFPHARAGGGPGGHALNLPGLSDHGPLSLGRAIQPAASLRLPSGYRAARAP